jgi:hypothetical protein
VRIESIDVVFKASRLHPALALVNAGSTLQNQVQAVAKNFMSTVQMISGDRPSRSSYAAFRYVVNNVRHVTIFSSDNAQFLQRVVKIDTWRL